MWYHLTTWTECAGQPIQFKFWHRHINQVITGPFARVRANVLRLIGGMDIGSSDLFSLMRPMGIKQNTPWIWVDQVRPHGLTQWNQTMSLSQTCHVSRLRHPGLPTYYVRCHVSQDICFAVLPATSVSIANSTMLACCEVCHVSRPVNYATSTFLQTL